MRPESTDLTETLLVLPSYDPKCVSLDSTHMACHEGGLSIGEWCQTSTLHTWYLDARPHPHTGSLLQYTRLDVETCTRRNQYVPVV